jgi:hypothetical protein
VRGLLNLSVFSSAIPNNFNQLPPVAFVEHGIDRHVVLFGQTPSKDCQIVVGVVAYAQSCTWMKSLAIARRGFAAGPDQGK